MNKELKVPLLFIITKLITAIVITLRCLSPIAEEVAEVSKVTQEQYYAQWVTERNILHYTR